MIDHFPKLMRTVVGKRLGAGSDAGSYCVCHVLSSARVLDFSCMLAPGLWLREEHLPFYIAAQGHKEAKMSQYRFGAKVTTLNVYDSQQSKWLDSGPALSALLCSPRQFVHACPLHAACLPLA